MRGSSTATRSTTSTGDRRARAVGEPRPRPEDRVFLCVDGVHGFGVEAATPAALGCDSLVAGCHKWLFGPRGTGLIWGRSDAWVR
jgi:selenocysteine lyase/cysteine desulfurase